MLLAYGTSRGRPHPVMLFASVDIISRGELTTREPDT